MTTTLKGLPMTESEKVARFVQLCKKLAREDLRHPERQPDFSDAIKLLGEVIDQQQHAIDRLQANVKKLESAG